MDGGLPNKIIMNGELFMLIKAFLLVKTFKNLILSPLNLHLTV